MRLDGRLPVLAGTAAGLAAAALLTLLQSSTYRADASIALVRQGQPPGDDPALAQAAEIAAELFHSRAVAEPAIANLRLKESADELLDRVDVESKPDSSLVRIEVDGPSRENARRTAQEVTEVATVLFNDRFGPQTVASIWEAPRVQDGAVSPKPARNLVLGALLGALLAQALVWRRRRPARAEGETPSPASASTAVDARVAALTRRELELARRAAELSLRERALEAPPAPIPAPRALEPQPESEREPEPEPVTIQEPAARPFVEPRLGEWTLGDVERLLAEQGPAFPDLREELGFYLDSFRDVAGPDGRISGGVEAVLEDVFRPLLERARSAPVS